MNKTTSTIKANHEIVELSATSYAVLEHFEINRGLVVRTTDLEDVLEDVGAKPNLERVRVEMSAIRRALAAIGVNTDKGPIKTMRGLGYKLIQ